MILGQQQKAKEQYEEGLEIDPENTHLLTDYGTYYMAQYYALNQLDNKNTLMNLDTAIQYMTTSYDLDPQNQDTTYKLSILY